MRPMLRRLPFLLATAALLTTTGAAAAPMARVALPLGDEGERTAQFTAFGPALAGDAVVFGVTSGVGGRPHLLAAPTAGGPARELPGLWSRFAGGDAGVVAITAVAYGGGTDRYDPSYVMSQKLTAGPVDGPAETLGTCIAPSDADGARVAYVAGEHCDEVVVRDVLAGREVGRLSVASPGTSITDLRLAGDLVSWRAGATVVVADATTGAVRRETLPVDSSGDVLGRDGSLAYVDETGYPSTDSDWRIHLMLLAPGAPAREVASWPAWSTVVAPVGFSGGTLVVRVEQDASVVSPRTPSDQLLAFAPDGTARPLLRALPVPEGDPHISATPELLGADVEDDRIAWTLRDCDEATVGSVALADLPPGGIDATRLDHCVRPILERSVLRVDRRGRTTVAVRCPAACSGTLTLTGMVSSGYRYRTLARRPFSLPAGRHRIAVAVAASDRAWLAHGKDRARPALLALAGTTGARPSSRFAQVRVVASR